MGKEKQMKVEILKECLSAKVGDIINVSFPNGDEQEYVDNGYIKLIEDGQKVILGTEFKIKQFEEFYDLLMQDAPKNYQPWFFPCEKNGKNPSPQAIYRLGGDMSLCCGEEWKPIERVNGKIKKKSLLACPRCFVLKSSWHGMHARLSKEQAIEHIKQGYNIGLSAREHDPLIIIDIDEVEYLDQLPKNTLTATSRKRAGAHAFCWDKDGSAKINLPTHAGEIRSSNQYVLACGSFVPFAIDIGKDKKAYDKLPVSAKNDIHIGYYTLRDRVIPREISFSECPQVFQDAREKEIKEEAIIKNKETDTETKEFQGEGKYSQLFKLKVSDIIEQIPSNQRVGHPLHESDTDANFSIDDEGGLAHCWRHLVSLNAVQFLCVKAGYKPCEECGTPHSNRGISKIKGDKKAFEVAYQEALKMGLIDEWKDGGDFLMFRINKKTGEEEFDRVNIDNVADYIISKYKIKTWFGIKSDYSFTFNGKIFEPNTRGVVKVECEKLLKEYCKRNVVDEVFEKIKRKTEINREEFEKTDVNFICFENGVWDIEKKELLPHDSKYNFQTFIPQKYEKDAKCPIWNKFISEVLYDDDIPVMQEWFGINLFREYFIKKAAICVGEKDTSKSVLLDTLINFIGEHNKTGLSLQKISGGNDFTRLSLKNRHANIYDDLSSQDLSDGGAFKVATGGGYISGEEKFGEYQQFRSFAKQMFATNKIPPVKDNDDLAYFGRWIVFKFDNVVENKDPFLRKKLWTPEEMSGILSWALEGLYRLLEKGDFSYDKTPEEIKQIMEESGCPLVAFSSDVLEREDGNVITKEEMFAAYTLWCDENKKPRLTKENLGRQLQKYCNYINSVKQKERIWQNAKFNDNYKKKMENSVVTGETIPTTDTSDTSQNNMRTFQNEQNTLSNMVYIKSEKVSEVSPKSIEEAWKK